MTNNWAGSTYWYKERASSSENTYLINNLTPSERNRFDAFLKSPASYASDSELAKRKVEFLLTTVKPKLKGIDLTNFENAKQKYDDALRILNSRDVPSCPICSSKMARRSGRYGEFWGCPRYPMCKGTINIRWNHK